jgi:nicotinamidase-related amidase
MPDGSDMLPLRKMSKVPAFTTESTEFQVIDELKPVKGELVISKPTRCGFIGTGLDHILRMVGIDTLAIGGALTNACVESTARGGADYGYKVILVDDACAAWDEQDHNAALKTFATFFGMVKQTDELIKVLSEKL